MKNLNKQLASFPKSGISFQYQNISVFVVEIAIDYIFFFLFSYTNFRLHGNAPFLRYLWFE